MTQQTTEFPLSSADWPQLQPLLRSLPAEQLLRLADWCREQAAMAPAQCEYSSADILLIAASQTGNARRVAEALRDTLLAASRAVQLVNAGDIDTACFPSSPLVLLVCATTGDGEPPEDALPFFHFLGLDQAPLLTQTRFAVLAMGNRVYPNFCQAGRDADIRLAALGAQRLLPCAQADADYQPEVARWTAALLPELLALTAPADETRLRSLRPSPIITPPAGRDNPQQAVLRACTRLTAEESAKNICHIVLDITGTGLTYQPGDALGVFAENTPDLTDELLALLWFTGRETVTVKGETMTLRDALTTRCELTLNSAPVVAAYAHLSKAPELLGMLADQQQLTDYAQRTPVADMVREFAVQTTAQAWIDCLPPMAPRLYSIASSPRVSPDEIHLTPGVVASEINGRMRYGAATRWLTHEVQPGGKITCYIEPNPHFRLPDDPAAPVIMIGPGTGIAPFRAFLQHRAAQQAAGQNWLITGNPHEQHDFLYREEWAELTEQGVLTRLTTAWSRDQAQKIYVQDRLLAQREIVWQWLQQGAYIYVCGDAYRMAKDVDAALLAIIRSEGGMSGEAAQSWLNTLRRAKRYQRDVY